MKISKIAIENEAITYTIDVVKKLVTDTKNMYHWIIGSDLVPEFHTWKESELLANMIQFLVVPRNNHERADLPENFKMITGEWMTSNISSSLIRSRIKQNLPITGLVLPGVEEVIQKRGLYK